MIIIVTNTTVFSHKHLFLLPSIIWDLTNCITMIYCSNNNEMLFSSFHSEYERPKFRYNIYILQLQHKRMLMYCLNIL